jgi:hypothetical protein
MPWRLLHRQLCGWGLWPVLINERRPRYTGGLILLCQTSPAASGTSPVARFPGLNTDNCWISPVRGGRMAPQAFLSPLMGLRNGNASLPGAHAAGLIPDAPTGLRSSPVDSASRHPHPPFGSSTRPPPGARAAGSGRRIHGTRPAHAIAFALAHPAVGNNSSLPSGSSIWITS